MRKKEETIDSNILFKIIKLIQEKKNYNQLLAKELKIKPSSLLKYLKRLEEEEIIISEREKKFNRKIYFLNYPTLLKMFIKYFCKNLEQEISEYYKLESDRQELENILKEIQKRFVKIVPGFNIFWGFIGSSIEENTEGNLKNVFYRTFLILKSIARKSIKTKKIIFKTCKDRDMDVLDSIAKFDKKEEEIIDGLAIQAHSISLEKKFSESKENSN